MHLGCLQNSFEALEAYLQWVAHHSLFVVVGVTVGHVVALSIVAAETPDGDDGMEGAAAGARVP